MDALLSLIAFLGAASRRLHSAEHKSLGSLLPRVAHALVQQLGAEQDGVRFGAAEELQRVLQVRGAVAPHHAPPISPASHWPPLLNTSSYRFADAPCLAGHAELPG